MAIEILLKSAAGPETVLAGVSALIAEGREDIHARDFIYRRMLGVAGEVVPPTFRLRATVSRGRYDREYVELRGMVEPTSEGGAHISIRCGWASTIWIGSILFTLVGLFLVLTGRDGSAFLFAFAAISAVRAYFRVSSLDRSNDETAYLLERLNGVLSAVDSSNDMQLPPTHSH